MNTDDSMPDAAPHKTSLNLDEIATRQDIHGRLLADLHAKIDHLTQGVSAVYFTVNYLRDMLSAVQQVASMMPGGKRILAAMNHSQNGGKSGG